MGGYCLHQSAQSPVEPKFASVSLELASKVKETRFVSMTSYTSPFSASLHSMVILLTEEPCLSNLAMMTFVLLIFSPHHMHW